MSVVSGTPVSKPWGSYLNLHEDEGVLVKVISVTPRQSLSLQSHNHRAEHWFVLGGVADVEIDGTVHRLIANEAIEIPLNARHRLSNPGDRSLHVLEVQYGPLLSEEDIIRYRDRYGRQLGQMARRELAMEKPVVICEVGCNHRGDLETALEMIKIAAQFCKVDVVKFQKRTNRELLTREEYDAPHPNPANSYGDSYGAHREFLEFDLDQHKALKAACDEWGVVYSSSVWDPTSAREIASLEPALIKVPSAINTDLRVMDILFGDYGGEIHVSLGMTTNAERETVVEMAQKAGRLKDLVLYHCISGYPVDVEELYLNEITGLLKAYGGSAKGIGFSGHHKGIAVDIAALALGADYFERHFTLDRTWKGTDHAASLEPDGMRRLARDLKAAKKALKDKPGEIVEIEVEQRRKLKRVREFQA
ncbi:MAG: N-acetylneuraminate synthase family protein [Hyphomicrobiales bacterium]